MELKARKDMDPKYQWDVSHIFPSMKEWQASFEEVEASIAVLESFAGTLHTSAAHLKEVLDTNFKVEEKFNKVYIYAMLNKAADGGDKDAQTMMAKVSSLMTKLGTAVSYLIPEFLSMEEEKVQEFMATGLLEEYAHYIDDISRNRPYTLDAQGEKMLAMLSDAASAAENTFDAFTDVDMEFPKVHNEKGELVQLTSGNFGVFRESPSRQVREEAFLAHFGQYKKYVNTIAEMYAGSVKFDCYFSSVRGYDSAAHAALFVDNAWGFDYL